MLTNIFFLICNKKRRKKKEFYFTFTYHFFLSLNFVKFVKYWLLFISIVNKKKKNQHQNKQLVYIICDNFKEKILYIR